MEKSLSPTVVKTEKHSVPTLVHTPTGRRCDRYSLWAWVSVSGAAAMAQRGVGRRLVGVGLRQKSISYSRIIEYVVLGVACAEERARSVDISHSLIRDGVAISAEKSFSQSEFDVDRDIVGKKRVEVTDNSIDRTHVIVALGLWGVSGEVEGSIDLHCIYSQRLAQFALSTGLSGRPSVN